MRYIRMDKGYFGQASNDDEIKLFFELTKAVGLLQNLKILILEDDSTAKERLAGTSEASDDELEVCRIDILTDFVSHKNLWDISSALNHFIVDGLAPQGTMDLFDTLIRHLEHVYETVKLAEASFDFSIMKGIVGFEKLISNTIGLGAIVIAKAFQIPLFLEDYATKAEEDVRVIAALDKTNIDALSTANAVVKVLEANLPILDIFDEDVELTERIMAKLNTEEILDLYSIMTELNLMDLKELDAGEINVDGLLARKGA